jgi:hypothetical protein
MHRVYRDFSATGLRPSVIQSTIDCVTLAKLIPFVAAVWLLGWGILFLGVPSFVSYVHRTFRGREPTANDIKFARFVGYIGIFSGSVALIQGLAGLAH